MRKLITLGLCALIAGSFSTIAVAGNVEDCEVLKDGYTKGLYGLCIAWHNAGSDRARERILDNYERKAGPNDPPLPGSEEGVPCPCWGTVELMDAACNRTLTASGPGFATYDAGLVQFFDFGTQCIYSNFNEGTTTIEATDAEQSMSCLAELTALINDDLLDLCE